MQAMVLSSIDGRHLALLTLASTKLMNFPHKVHMFNNNVCIYEIHC